MLTVTVCRATFLWAEDNTSQWRRQVSIIAFKKVNDDFGWLGNMSAHKIKAGRKIWRTAEALFQALRFDDEEIQEIIRLKTSPMTAKMAAKSHKSQMVIVPQSADDLAIMMTVLRLKLLYNPELKIALLGTFDATIIEDCTNRPGGSGLFWGAALKDGVWVGENQLGRLWMRLRSELRNNR